MATDDTVPAGGIKRLMIRQMVLENFKSYAGAQHVGPFHKSFSSVVGPNGSGKSNVIDAMLFVFGRRAKQLRFSKLSELIHNSTNHQNLEMAKVSVYFQEIIDKEGEEYEVIPGTEFVVARTAHRNNSSDYYVDGRKVTTKEVTDLLKKQGIDLDNNRFLILQGEVEQISMMKPKAEDKHDTGMLEYLEDIIGTDKYVMPIEEEAKKLEEITEQRAGMIQRLKVVEREKEGLEAKAKDATEFLDKQADMLRNRIRGQAVFVLSTEVTLRDVDKKVADFGAKLAHEKGKGAAYEGKLRAAEATFTAAEKEFKAVVRALETAQELYKEMERRDAKCQLDMKHLKAKLKKAVAKMEADKASVQKLEADVVAVQEDMPLCRERAERLNSELVQHEKVLEDLLDGIRGEVEHHHQALRAVRAELAPWEQKMQQVSGRIGVAESERALLTKKADDGRARLEAALAAMTEAYRSATTKRAQVTEIEAANAACRKQLEKHRTGASSGRAEEQRLEGELATARGRVAQLRQDVASQAGRGQVVAGLLAAKNRGELTGVYGRLGDLGAIDTKYDIAVSTAVGALDYVVVETASDAQRCVEHLRRHNLGVATFLILEKQKHLEGRAGREKVQVPEGMPRLFDLVKIKDERLRPAFYYAMGDCVVANDLEQASRIAYSPDDRFRRVVTLQGQLIAESGTMSGGGNRPVRGRMALGSAAPRAVDAKEAEQELKHAEQEMEALVAALKAARDQVTTADNSLRDAERQLSKLEGAAPKARMEAEAEAAKAADIEARLAELKAGTKVGAEDAKRIAELQAEAEREGKELAKLKRECQGLERQAAELQAKIDGAGGDKLKKQRALVSQTRREIDEAEAEVVKKGVRAKNNAKQVAKLQKEVAQAGKEVEKMEADEVQAVADTAALEDKAMAVMEEVQRVQAAVVEREAELESARTERDRMHRDFHIVRKTEVEIEAALDNLAKIKKEEGAKIAKWRAEIGNLTSQLSEVTGQQEDADKVVGDPEQLVGRPADEFILKATFLESELEKLNPDMSSIDELRAKLVDWNQRTAELEVVTNQRDQTRKRYEGLRKSRLDEFMAGFNLISLRLKEMYQMITLGGDAELELVDSMDPFSEGVIFSVRPPKKSWKHISNLSGGEKTLSSLSLVFALHHYKPTPLYVMDEIDAALDFKNVSIVGHYIKERTKNAQFIIISLRNNMFELADRLVGIYKTDNCTKTVAINPGEFAVGTPSTAAQESTDGLAAGPQQTGTAEIMVA